jgi:hypothetical protein
MSKHEVAPIPRSAASRRVSKDEGESDQRALEM